MSGLIHDPGAELALLAGLLAFPQTRTVVARLVGPSDFASDLHGDLAAVLWDLEDYDPQAVLTTCQRRGLPHAVRLLPSLVGRETVAEHVVTHAQTVRDCSRRRRFRETSLRGVQHAETPTISLEDAVIVSMTVLEELIDTASTEDVPPMAIDAFLAGEDRPDWVVEGLIARSDRVVLTGGEGAGKALAWDTPIPTPKGWRLMAELTVGEQVFDSAGHPTSIVAATEVMLNRPCYRVRFSDGQEIVADAEHLWRTETLQARESAADEARRGPTKLRGTDQRWKRKHFPALVTTREMSDTLRARSGHALNHAIPTCAPLAYPTVDLLVDPYTLGAWLGDGTSAGAQITCAPVDEQIINEIRRAGYTAQRYGETLAWSITRKGQPARPKPFVVELRELGVLRNKHIPRSYLEASVAQRLALLQGLMDTDGGVTGEGGRGRGTGTACEFTSTSPVLAGDVRELLLGLGIKATLRTGTATLNGRVIGPKFRLCFQTALSVFRLQRKVDRLEPLRTRRSQLRYVTAVEPISSVPVRCIQVEGDGMFLAGRGCIPTHNSEFARQVAVCVAAGVHPFKLCPVEPKRVLIVDLENSRELLRSRLRALAHCAKRQGRPVDPDRLRIINRPSGVDLGDAMDSAWLARQVELARPDLIVGGPLYRMHTSALDKEDAARQITVALDTICNRSRAALILEAHAGHGVGGQRWWRPTGSSLFMRWAQFGLGLRTTKRGTEVTSWRGARDMREWPEALRRGENTWPWLEAAPFADHEGQVSVA